VNAQRHGRGSAGFGSLTAPGLVLAQIASLQLGSAVAKGLFADVGITATAAIRITLAAIVLCALVRPRIRSFTPAQWRAALSLGVVFAAMNLAYFQAIGVLPLGVAATLELLGPLLLAVALTHRSRDLAWVALAVTGVLLLSGPGGRLPLLGIGLGLLAAGCRAGYVLLNGQVGRLFGDWSGLAVALAIGACLLAPIGVVSGGTRLLDPGVLTAGVLVALLSSLLPYSLDLVVLRRITPRVFGILLSLSPAVGALVGFVVLAEALTRRQVLAILLVVVACVGAVAAEARTVHPHPEGVVADA
jgi:inner membrane transporter RhtA